MWLATGPAYGPLQRLGRSFADLPLIVKKKPRPSATARCKDGTSAAGASINKHDETQP